MEMVKKLFVLILVLIGSVVYADYVWTDGAQGDHSWNNAGNWTPGVPTNAAPAQIELGDPSGAVIDSSVTGDNAAIARHLYLAKTGGSVGELYIAGGDLSVSYDFLIGDAAGSNGYLEMSGGTLSVGRYPRWGGYGVGIAKITGGVIDSTSSNEFYVGLRGSGYGEVDMSGGILNIAKHLRIGHQGSGKFILSGDAQLNITYDIETSTTSTGEGLFIVNGGTVSCRDISVGAEGVGNAEINGGLLALNGKVVIGLRSSAAGSGMVVSGGTLDLPGTTLGAQGIRVGNEGSGSLVVTGGTINIGAGLHVPYSSDLASGHIDLNGGTINTRDLIVQTNNGSVDITEGVLVIDGDVTGYISNLVSQNVITAYGGRSTIIVDTEINPGKTTVSAIPVNLEQAWNPSPSNALGDVAFASTLSWSAGDNAVSHDVYFGTDSELVSSANNLTVGGVYKGNQAIDSTIFDLGILLPGQTYYWRIDEVKADDSIVTGQVWSFTVANYIVLEDFEQYADSSALKNVWSSPVELETELISGNGGLNCMKLAYNNASQGEVTVAVKNLGGLDFTANSMKALYLSCHGSFENQPDTQVFVELTDANGNKAKVVGSLSDSIPQLLSEPWFDWNIAYHDFTEANDNIDLTSVNSMAIGVQNVSVGTIYFDNIRLYIDRCIPDMVAESFNGDCLCNLEDLSVLADSWNDSETVVVASMPQTSPIVYYNFDETSGTVAFDQIDGNNATVSSDLLWNSDGVNNGCLDFDGSSYAFVPVDPFLDVEDPNYLSVESSITVSFWANVDPNGIGTQYVFHGATENKTGHIIAATLPSVAGSYIDIEFHAGHLENQQPDWPYWYWGWDIADWDDCRLMDYANSWNHYAFTKDATTGEMKIYCNGALVAETLDAYVTLKDLKHFVIGCFDKGSKSLFFNGKLDEFKVYDTALSHSEILTLAGYSAGETVVEFTNKDKDLSGDGVVGIGDITLLADKWLTEQLWPFN